MKRTYFAITVIAFVLLGAAHAHAQTSTCTNFYQPGIPVPSGYGAAYDIVGGTNQLLVQAVCAAQSTLNVGRGSANDYVYKLGYVFQNNTWQPLNLTSTNALVSTAWYPASATAGTCQRQ